MTTTTSSATRLPVVGPLTTVFAVPPGCDSCRGYSDNHMCTMFFEGCSSYGSCMPGSPAAPTELVGPRLLYSPGFYCPDGWATVLTIDERLSNQDGASTLLDALLPGETGALCCPKYYELFFFADFSPGMCISTTRLQGPDGLWPFTYCGANTQYLTSYTYDDNTMREGLVKAPIIQLLRRPGDELSTSTFTITETPTGEATSTFVTTSHSTVDPSVPSTAATSALASTSIQTPAPTSTELGSGGLAPGMLGEVVGGTVAGTLVLVVLSWFTLRLLRQWARAARREAAAGSVAVDAVQDTGKGGGDTKEGELDDTRVEMSELPSPSPCQPAELYGTTPSELDGVAVEQRSGWEK